MAPYRILVVDDSAFMRKIVSDIVNSDETLTVVGTARNGKEAVEAVKRLRPDAVTLDVEMPEMNGLEALPLMMQAAPTPVIMLSSSTQEGTDAAIQALELGAFDFIEKPSGPISMGLYTVQASLLAKLHTAVAGRKAGIIGKLQPAVFPPRTPTSPPPSPSSASPPKKAELGKTMNRLVAIGTSTGGPRALQQVLTRLPEHFPAPILIVQHMPPGFTKSLANRLDTLCQIHVTEAEDGMEPLPGVAYIAPGGTHMYLRKESASYKIRLSGDPPRSGHRPSVDVLFESLAEYSDLDRTVVLMTGMGSDGAKGMKELYDQGVRRTIAEHPESCIVYGMPRAAVELGCVKKLIPLESIAKQLITEVTQVEEV